MDFKEFYYIQTQSGESYQSIPTQRPSIARLIHNPGEPYWIAGNAEATKQKKLILADWTAVGWSDEKTQAVITALTRLMDDGFVIYRWQYQVKPSYYQKGLDKAVIPLTKGELAQLADPKFRATITPAFPEEIKAIASDQQKLIRDEIQILDDYWIECILNDHEYNSTQRSLRVSDYTLSSNKLFYQNRYNLGAILSGSTPPITRLVHDEFSEGKNESFEELSKEFPGLQKDIQYKKANLSNSNLMKALTQPPLFIGKASLDLEQLAALSELRITNPTFVENGWQMLSEKMPHLKKLSLSNGQNIVASTPFESNHFSELEEFSVVSSSSLPCFIAAETLQALLERSTKLKVLRMDRIIAGEMTFAPESLASLEKLSLGNAISAANLDALLKGAHKLKTFIIDKFPEDFYLLAPKSLPSLRIFKSETSKITLMQLQHLLNAAPALEILTLLFYKPVDSDSKDGLQLDQHSLLSLKEIILNNSTISVASLQTLLKAAPFLRILNLRECTNLSEMKNLEPNSLLYLEEINLKESNISAAGLQALLAAAPNLKILNIEKCKNLEGPTVPLSISFFSLEKLNLNNAVISPLFFQSLIKTMINLKELDLQEIKNINALLMTLEADSLGKLIIIELGDTRLNEEVFAKLRAAAPQLHIKTWKQPRSFEEQSRLRYSEASTTLSYEPRTDRSSKTVNADTHLNPDKEFNLSRIFYATESNRPDPDVTDYRLEAFDEIIINPGECLLSQAFTINKRGSLQLGNCNITHLFSSSELRSEGQRCSIEEKTQAQAEGQELPDYQYVYGKHSFKLKKGEWQAIPSLSPNEVMTHYYVNPATARIQITYSKRDNLYYLYNPSNEGFVQLDFLLKVPRKQEELADELPPELKDLVRKYRDFGSGTLRLPNKTTHTGEDYLRYIRGEGQEEGKGKGACRHRAIAFVREIQEAQEMRREYQGIETRIVENDCHMFVEVNINGKWIKCDLGGYPAKLKIHENNPAQLVAEEDSASTSTSTSTSAPLRAHPPKITLAQLTATGAESASMPSYEEQLQTWHHKGLLTNTPEEYCQHCLQLGTAKKRLIKLESTQSVNAMFFALQEYCLATQRPVFYVRSPEDLICSSAFIERQKGSDLGILKKGPGGPLYDFLQAHKDPRHPPLIIVNYEQFKDSDLVRFNALLDKERYAHGVKLPNEETFVIGLFNINKPNPYQGSDFHGRFDKNEMCPIAENVLIEKVPEIPGPNPNEENPTGEVIIRLYHATYWKSLLLGSWTLEGDSLIFEKGALLKALERGATSIEIHQGLWQDEAFNHFWQQAALLGYIDYAGERITIPENLTLIRKNEYEWDQLRLPNMKINVGLSKEGLILNPDCLSQFFRRYECDKASSTLKSLKGYIEEAAGTGKELIVNLTRELNEDDWARLLVACKEHDVELIVHCAPGVTLPAGVGVAPAASEVPLLECEKTTIMVSGDRDTTVAMLTSPHRPAVYEDFIIDVSELNSADLLGYIDGALDAEALRFHFHSKTGVLINLLDDASKEKRRPRRVILTGHFSEELSSHLANYLLEREKNPSRDQLIIVSENELAFSGFNARKYEVAPIMKIDLLGDLGELSERIRRDLEPRLSTEPLAKLKARRNYLLTHPDAVNSDECWAGMHHLTSNMLTVEKFQFNARDDIAVIEDRIIKESEAFMAARLAALKDAVKSVHDPCVFVTGLSGVGKSTFIEAELKKDGNFYEGENELEKWAQDDSDERKWLFIDEANLSASDWTIFEGLYFNPRSIVIKGQSYSLDPEKHKVVFAGNPCSYGDERKLASFFERHGNAITFDPLPAAVLYQQIIKPIFEDTSLSKKLGEHLPFIAKPLLDVYRFLCASSEKEVLISPRELQMIALFVNQYIQASGEELDSDDIMAVSQYAAWDLARNLVPAKERRKFDAQFKIPMPPSVQAFYPDPAPRRDDESEENDYALTQSREPVSQRLHQLFALREWRQENARQERGNAAQQYGGLGGIVLEGEPGCGKSELVIKSLIDHGFKEIHDLNKPITLDKAFYHMPVSLSDNEKEEILLKAFDEGIVVVIDEVNSSSMMERLLNDLLMGKRPANKKENASDVDATEELTDKKPRKLGFMVIGTQNPISMAGRRLASTALQRRLINVNLAPYSREEMEAILKTKEVPPHEIHALLQAYTKQRAYAEHNRLTPVPTFRDVIRISNVIISNKKEAQSNRGERVLTKMRGAPDEDLPKPTELGGSLKNDREKDFPSPSETLVVPESINFSGAARESASTKMPISSSPAGFFAQPDHEKPLSDLIAKLTERSKTNGPSASEYLALNALIFVLKKTVNPERLRQEGRLELLLESKEINDIIAEHLAISDWGEETKKELVRVFLRQVAGLDKSEPTNNQSPRM